MLLKPICVILFVYGANSFNPYICPKDFAGGIPFDLYGSPIFPVALYDKNNDEVFTPFWVNVSGTWMDELEIALNGTSANDCLHEDLPKCDTVLRATFASLLKDLFPFQDRPRISYYLINVVDEDEWGTARLFDFHNATMVLVRRTLLVQCIYWCHTMLRMPPENRPMMLEMCPNPCNQAGVCSGAGEVTGTCKLTEEGFFSHQYKCECKEGYAWIPSVEGCIPDNPCERKESPVCYPNGTLMCSYDPDLFDVSCLCKPEYMGDNCSIPANACEDLIRNPLLPNGGLLAVGNRACNINNDGNRCVPSHDPSLGPIYTCVCAEGRWAGDVSLGYDNCLKKVTKCDQIICIKGKCVDSRDGKEAVCVCEEGYDSPMCATWTGVWSEWNPWSRCMPACGIERWAIRTRRCLSAERFGVQSEHMDCLGPSIDYSPCDPHKCAPEEGVVLAHYFEIREHALQAILVLSAVAAVMLAFCWRYSFYSRLAFRLRRMFHKPHQL